MVSDGHGYFLFTRMVAENHGFSFFFADGHGEVVRIVVCLKNSVIFRDTPCEKQNILRVNV